MAIELLNPPALPASPIYAQVAVATGARTVYVSGQVAITADGTHVGPGDLAAQVEQAYLNLAAALEAAGATFADVASQRVYVVDWAPEKVAALGEGVGRVAEKLGFRPTAMTLIGVVALGEPDLLVEIEAVAVLA